MWDQPELLNGPQSPEDGGRTLASGHVTLSTSLVEGEPEAVVHMPHRSPWPFFVSAGMLITFYALLIDVWVVAAAGAVATVFSIMGWLSPRGETQET